MKRDRAQAFVCRNGKILLVEHVMRGRDFYNLPGGGLEEGETPEEAALRELQEETGVTGRILRPLTIEYKPDLESRIFTAYNFHSVHILNDIFNLAIFALYFHRNDGIISVYHRFDKNIFDMFLR